MTDKESYQAIIDEIETFLSDEEAEEEIRKAWNNITRAVLSNLRPSHSSYFETVKRYGSPEWCGFVGFDAFEEARKDLKFFKTGIKNIR